MGIYEKYDRHTFCKFPKSQADVAHYGCVTSCDRRNRIYSSTDILFVSSLIKFITMNILVFIPFASCACASEPSVCYVFVFPQNIMPKYVLPVPGSYNESYLTLSPSNYSKRSLVFLHNRLQQKICSRLIVTFSVT